MNMMQAVNARDCDKPINRPAEYVALAEGADPMIGTLNEIVRAIDAISEDCEEPIGNENRYTLESYDGNNFFCWDIIKTIEAARVI